MMWWRLVGHDVEPCSLDQHAAAWHVRVCAIEADIGDPWRVARTDLDDGRFVSTVFLSIDHRWDPTMPPQLFESMTFPECECHARYSTWDQALAGHDQIVAAMRESTIRNGG